MAKLDDIAYAVLCGALITACVTVLAIIILAIYGVTHFGA